MVEKNKSPWLDDIPLTQPKKEVSDSLMGMFQTRLEEEMSQILNTPKPKSTPDRWLYEDKLKVYFLSLGKDPQNVEPIHHYPRSINFPDSWNNAFIEVANDTKKDGFERFCVLAVNQAREGVLLPIKAVKGERLQISHELREEQFAWAKTAGADTVIGSFHSHPTVRRKPFTRRFSYDSTMTVSDFYPAVIRSNEFVTGVIQVNNEIAVAFKTAETHLEEDLNYLPVGYRDQKSFSDYWYRTKGLVVNPSAHTIRRQDNRSFVSGEWLEILWELNHEIAEKHNLALYHGKLGSSLARFNPPSIDNQWHDFFIGKTDKPPDIKMKKK